MLPFASRKEQIETQKDIYAVQQEYKQQTMFPTTAEQKQVDIAFGKYLAPGTTAYKLEQARQRTVDMFGGVPVVSSLMVGFGEFVKMGLFSPVSVPGAIRERGKRLPEAVGMGLSGTVTSLVTRPGTAIPEMIGFGAGFGALGILGRGVGRGAGKAGRILGETKLAKTTKAQFDIIRGKGVTYLRVPRGAGGSVTLRFKDPLGLEAPRPPSRLGGKPKILRTEQLTPQELAMRTFEANLLRITEIKEAVKPSRLLTAEDLSAVVKERVKVSRIYDKPLDIKFFEGKPRLLRTKQLSIQEMAMREFNLAQKASKAFEKHGWVTFGKALKKPRVVKTFQPTAQELAMANFAKMIAREARAEKSLLAIQKHGNVFFGKKVKQPRIVKTYTQTLSERAMQRFDLMVARETRATEALLGIKKHGRVLFDEPLFPKAKPRVLRVTEPKKVTMLEFPDKDAVTFPAKPRPFKWLEETKKKPPGLELKTKGGQIQLLKTKTKPKVKTKAKVKTTTAQDPFFPGKSYTVSLLEKTKPGISALMFPLQRKKPDYTFRAIELARIRGLEKAEGMLNVLTREKTTEAEKELLGTKTRARLINLLKPRATTKAKEKELGLERQIALFKPKQMALFKPRLLYAQYPRGLIIPRGMTRLVDLLKTPPPPPPRITRQPPPTKIIPRPKPEKKEVKKKEKKTIAYNVLVRRKGEWLLLEKGLPKGLALKAGEEYSLKTLGASFKVEAIGTTDLLDIDYRPKEDLFRSFKIVKGKRVPLKDTFIQRRGKRLITGSERKGIQLAKKVKAGSKKLAKSLGLKFNKTKKRRLRK